MATTLTKEDIMTKVSTGRAYVLLLLKNGRDLIGGEDFQSMQMAHLAHLFNLESEGKIHIFGPVTTESDLKGIIIFGTSSKDEVHEWMKEDPLCSSGLLTYELYDWFTIPGQGIPALSTNAS
jgi:uncharacterized protein YciI